MKKLMLDNLVYPETCNQTIVMTGNDLGRVYGDLNFTRINHPGRSAQRYWDKVLCDPKHDRN